MAYGNGMFVAVSSSTAAAYSTDGIHWTASTLPSTALISVAYGNGVFVALRNSSTAAAYSTDGINWTAGTIPAGYWFGMAARY